jgi:hypothetical protein
MKKALMTVGVIAGLVVALAIDISVLLGLLPVGAAACVALVFVLIFTATNPSNPKTSPGRGFAYVSAAPASRAAENGDVYVITGKSIYNNPGKFE